MASESPAAPLTRGVDAPRHSQIGPRWFTGILIALFFVTAALAGTQSPCNNDLGGVFLPSARFVVGGQPLDMYQVRVGVYPNANGPLGEVVIGGALALGRLVHLQQIGPLCPHVDAYPVAGDSIALRMWLALIFAIFPFLIGLELLRLADRAIDPPLYGWRRAAVWSIALLMPAVWDSLIYYGHIEQTIGLWLTLLAVRWFSERRMLWSGVALGLALLNRTADIFVVVPLALLLLRDLRWRSLAIFGGAIVATLAIGLGPFLVHDRADTLYSLLTFRSQLPIGDGSFWTFFQGTPYAARAQGLDSTVGLLGAAITSAVLLWGGRVRDDEPALYGVVALSVLWFSVSIKAIWGYYFYDPQIWLLAWALYAPMVAGSRVAAANTLVPWWAGVGTQVRWWAIIGTPIVISLALGLTEWRIGASDDSTLSPNKLRLLQEVLSAATSVVLLVLQTAVFILILRRPRSTAPAFAPDKPVDLSPDLRLFSQRT